MRLLDGLRTRWRYVRLSQERSQEQVLLTLLGLLAAWGRRTVTGAICYLGLAQRDWSGRYRHFSRSPWEAVEIFRVNAAEAVRMIPSDHPFIPVSLDDTSLPSASAKGGLASYGRDPLSPKFHVNLRRGLRHLHAAIVVPRYEERCRPLAVSTAFDLCPPLAKPARKAGPEIWRAWRVAAKQRSLSVVAIDVLRRHRQWIDAQGREDTCVLAVVDNSYTNRTVIRGLPERTHLIGRCRKNCVLSMPGPTPKRYGAPAPTPHAFYQDDAVPWSTATCHYAGSQRCISYKVSGELRWRATGTQIGVRIIVLRPLPYNGPGGHRSYRQPAYLITTNLNAPAELLIQAYLDRWQIEVLHRDLKHDCRLGNAQVRNPRSVAKLHAAVVGMNAMLQLAAQEHCQRRRTDELPPLPAWRRLQRRRTTSQQELITLLRSEMASSGLTPPPTDQTALTPREWHAQAG